MAWLLALVGSIAVIWRNWRLARQESVALTGTKPPPATPPLHTWPDTPLVSVLVAAWNEGSRIEQHMESFLSLRYPHKELVLCAGGTDDTLERAQQYADPHIQQQIHVYEQLPGEGKQRALHRAFAHTRGSVIYLTDADCRLNDACFEGMVYPIASGQEQVCSGGAEPDAGAQSDPFVALQGTLQRYGTLHAPDYTNGILGRNCTVQRSLLEASGGLAAPAPTGTDYVLAQELVRHGARIRQRPDLRVTTGYPNGGGAYIRQQRRWLRNLLIHGRRYGDRASVRHGLVTSLMGVASLGMPLGALCFTSAGLAPVILWWFTMLVQRIRYVYVATRAGEPAASAVEAKGCWLLAAGRWLSTGTALGKLILFDCVAWSLVFLDMWLPAWREKW